MLFSRTYRYQSSMPKEDIKSRLIGKHVLVQNMDFEVYENDQMLRIIPHAEDETSLRTLPITHVEFNKGKGNKTQVVVSSKMRKIDSGGPLLIVIFCCFMLIAAVLFFIYGGKEYVSFTYTLLAISLTVFLVFWFRLETGYFRYIRKIRDHVKKESAL